ncbi:MAG: glycoside hydrolase family 32 protein [Phycisphaerae bacterium]|nr:glycoside hydrolase family 32 protein [Phycisphaerae bacterium]
MCQHRPTITPWLLSAILVSCLLTNTTARADEQTAPPPEPASTAPDSQTGAPLYDQLYRPQFHFTAARNWLNDPNGLVFYKGEYHLFFQHNPIGIAWGNMTWGHAISTDLVHWRQLPNALEPDALGTMFSGSAVVDWPNSAGFQQGTEKTLVAIYTAAGGTSDASKGQPFTQCIAYSNDRGRSWTKYAGNPVLPHLVGSNRDPKVVWHQPSRHWIMALFMDGNTFALFNSPDLKQWNRLHDINMPDSSECPDFFEMPVTGEPGSRKWVLTAANGRYFVGTFDGQRFTPETGPHPSDLGANFYAVQTYSDIPPTDDRRIQIAWMAGAKYPDMPFNQQMSFPCELTLHRSPEGLRLRRQPVREIERLYTPPHNLASQTLHPGQNPLADLQGDLFDIQAQWNPQEAETCGFVIRGERVTYDVKQHQLTCLGRSAELQPIEGKIELRILVDRSSIEIFANAGRVSMSSCFLPKPEDHSLAAFATGGPVQMTSLRVHRLRSAWQQ